MSSEAAPPRIPFYFTVDFEDIGADMLRGFGIDLSARAREDLLWRTYENIQGLIDTVLGGRPATFFCTGVLGLYARDLLAQIARDGHEIGCHYHFHDAVAGDSPELVERRVAEAIDALQEASGSEVVGFRAPMFSIEATNVGQYRRLAARFAYDSSLIADVGEGFREADFSEISDHGRMRLFPVPAIRKLGRVRHKAGGTFFKLFPLGWTEDALAAAHAQDLAPVFYLHPYEFVSDGRFRLSLRELQALGAARQAYWWLRQTQWHNVGNGAVHGKLSRLTSRFEHQGPMRDLISA
jgi:hypothetical protein